MSDDILIGSLNNSILLLRVSDRQFVFSMAHMIRSGAPNLLRCWNMHLAVSSAVTPLVGYNSTQRENASIITNTYWWPFSSMTRGQMWSSAITSKG